MQGENFEPSAEPVGKPELTLEPRAVAQLEPGKHSLTRAEKPQGLMEKVAPTWKNRTLSHLGRSEWTAMG